MYVEEIWFEHGSIDLSVFSITDTFYFDTPYDIRNCSF